MSIDLRRVAQLHAQLVPQAAAAAAAANEEAPHLRSPRYKREGPRDNREALCCYERVISRKLDGARSHRHHAHSCDGQ
jgi:hypothetical protein